MNWLLRIWAAIKLLQYALYGEHEPYGRAPGRGKPEQSPELIWSKIKAEQTHEERHRRKEQKFWRNYIWLSFFTSVGAIASAGFALLALQASQNANFQAQRQAIAAEKNLARAWFYVEFPPFPGKFELTVLPDPKDPQHPDQRSFGIEFPIIIHNYGQIPGSITDCEGILLIPNRPDFSDNPPSDIAAAEGLFASEEQILRRVIVGTTIGPTDKFEPITPTSFNFPHQPDIRLSPIVLPHWFFIKIQYRDPNGDNRETGYFGKIGPTGATTINNKKYTYWR